MNLLKKSVKFMVALGLCLCTVLSVSTITVSAQDERKVAPLCEYPMWDVCYHYEDSYSGSEIFVHKGFSGGTVEYVGGTDNFPLETGEKIFKAVPADGYKFDGWTYELYIDSEWDSCNKNSFNRRKDDLGNREDNGKYTFSKVGDPYVVCNKDDLNIQLNRLSRVGPEYYTIAFRIFLHFELIANFSRI